MPWQVEYRQDTEASGLGTVAAVFTDGDGQVTYRYERQVKTMSPDDCLAFSVEAKAKLAAMTSKVANEKTRDTKIMADILKELNK